jgi:hypothetical protein
MKARVWFNSVDDDDVIGFEIVQSCKYFRPAIELTDRYHLQGLINPVGV